MKKELKDSQTIALLIQTKGIRLKLFLNDVFQAIKGTELDYTSISLSKAIFLLAIPMVVEMLMESLFAIVDIYFVSKIGSDAVATVGITESLMTLVYAFGAGLSAGTTAIVSRRTGEKNTVGAYNAAFQAIILGFFISFFISIPGILFPKEILRFMGASENIVNNYSGYTAIMLGGNVTVLLLFVINSAFRSSGDATIAMRVLIIGNFINMILDPLLIFGIGPFPELGIKGAAIATTTGRGIAVLIQLYYLFSGKRRIIITREHMKFNWPVLKSIIRLSGSGTLQSIIATSSWVAMVRIISQFGSEAVAGYTIAIRIIIFTLLPSWGLSNAAATLVGQNLGAGKPERAEKSAWITGAINMIFLGAVGLVLIAFPEKFISFFIDNQLVITEGSVCLRMISFGFVFYGLSMVMMQSINGAGDTNTPMLINFFCFWIIEVPLAYILAIKAGMDENGVYTAILVAEALISIISFLIFRKGKWKLNKV